MTLGSLKSVFNVFRRKPSLGVPDLWAAITRFGNKTLLFTKLYKTAGPFALILITINYLRHNAVNVKGII